MLAQPWIFQYLSFACGDMMEEELNLQPKDLEDNKAE